MKTEMTDEERKDAEGELMEIQERFAKAKDECDVEMMVSYICGARFLHKKLGLDLAPVVADALGVLGLVKSMGPEDIALKEDHLASLGHLFRDAGRIELVSEIVDAIKQDAYLKMVALMDLSRCQADAGMDPVPTLEKAFGLVPSEFDSLRMAGAAFCRGDFEFGIEIIKEMPDPEARIRLVERLLFRLDSLVDEETADTCKWIREDAEEACRIIRERAKAECASVMQEARDRHRFARQKLEFTRCSIRSGEFQKPDFAKKPAPQPAEEKAKRGDKI